MKNCWYFILFSRRACRSATCGALLYDFTNVDIGPYDSGTALLLFQGGARRPKEVKYLLQGHQRQGQGTKSIQMKNYKKSFQNLLLKKDYVL